MTVEDQSYSVQVKLDVSISYRTYLPDGYSEDREASPMLMFLHGSGECDTDLDQLERASLPNYIKNGLKIPFVVVCPQCESMWNARTLDKLLDKVIDKYNVDPARIYLTGNSLGGLGTWMLANVAADRLAAIAPVCAPSAQIKPENFKDLPIRIFHGVMDSVVPISESVNMVRQIRNAGGDVRFTVYADRDHDSWIPAYRDSDMMSWLLSHRKQ